MKTAKKMMAMVVAMVVCVAIPASASVGPLLNGSFEEYTETAGWDIWGIPGQVTFAPADFWPEPAGGPVVYAGSMYTGTESINATQGERFLRLATDGGVVGRVAQDLGTMVAGETYTFEADVIASTQYGDYAAKALFVNEAVAFPGTIYATSPIVSVAQGATGPLSFTYTATAGDNDMPLYIMLQSEGFRGGMDNARLTIAGGAVPEPAGLGLVGLALLAIRKRRS